MIPEPVLEHLLPHQRLRLDLLHLVLAEEQYRTSPSASKAASAAVMAFERLVLDGTPIPQPVPPAQTVTPHLISSAYLITDGGHGLTVTKKYTFKPGG